MTGLAWRYQGQTEISGWGLVYSCKVHGLHSYTMYKGDHMTGITQSLEFPMMIIGPQIFVVWKDGQFRVGGGRYKEVPLDNWKAVIKNLLNEIAVTCVNNFVLPHEVDVNLLVNGEMKKIDNEARIVIRREYVAQLGINARHTPLPL
jgi:hypothetical protein